MRTWGCWMLLIICAAAQAYVPPCNISRGIYISAAPLLPAAAWSRFGTGYEFTTEQAHSGQSSVKCVNPGGPKSGAGVAQDVTVNQTQAAPLKLSGWSRAEGVADDTQA